MTVAIISFISAIVSSIFVTKCKSRIDILIDYGNPIYHAAEHIKEIIHQMNVYGVDSMKGLIEKSMKNKLAEIVKQKGKT